jgi:hypothetical protein
MQHTLVHYYSTQTHPSTKARTRVLLHHTQYSTTEHYYRTLQYYSAHRYTTSAQTLQYCSTHQCTTTPHTHYSTTEQTGTLLQNTHYNTTAYTGTLQIYTTVLQQNIGTLLQHTDYCAIAHTYRSIRTMKAYTPS